MRRIVILGCSGSGKSTLARRLGARLGLPVVHLDVLYWRPGWQVPDPAGFRGRVAAAVAGEAWVCEGNYRDTFDLRLPRAELVIVVDAPRWLRLLRVVRRSFGPGRRDDLPAGCPEHLDWELMTFIWRFDRRSWPRIDRSRLEHGAGVPVVRLGDRRAVEGFLAGLHPGGGIDGRAEIGFRTKPVG